MRATTGIWIYPILRALLSQSARILTRTKIRSLTKKSKKSVKALALAPGFSFLPLLASPCKGEDFY